MSSRVIQLDERRYRLVEQRAAALGTTPEEFIAKLIDREESQDERTFDEILEPVRRDAERYSDEELDATFERALRRVRGRDE